MPRVDLVVKSEISQSPRARQLEAMFDVPPQKENIVEWHGEVDFDGEPWNVGLIVGPSGSGKSTIARELFGDRVDWAPAWQGKSVVDDFSDDLSMDQITKACSAVGFNTIPAWLRPYKVLSTGEKFRVEMARRLLEMDDPIVVDEFTSVVDRQVAQIGAHAVQKRVRKDDRKFVAVSCHYDIVEWLQPDWIFEPATMKLARRSLQRRPEIRAAISRVPYHAWRLFSKHHYLTKRLHRNAKCFCLFVGGTPTTFAGLLYSPHASAKKAGRKPIYRISRIVTLPDWQGLGLAMVMMDQLGAACRADGKRLRINTAHPGFMRSIDRSANWRLEVKPGSQSSNAGKGRRKRTTIRRPGTKYPWRQGSRFAATFEYVGPAMGDARRSQRFLGMT